MRVLGLDGCKHNSWVVAESDPDLTEIKFTIEGDLSAMFREAGDGRAVIVLDVPIGLGYEKRASDIAVRKLLKPHRHNSVFRPPCRDALVASSFAEALTTNQRCCSDRKGLSQQAFHIRERIRAVDDLITPALQERVREGHPEVTFAILNDGRPMKHHKRTPEGLAERLAVLEAVGVGRFDPAATRIHLGRSAVEIDDIVDAVAMLITAKRILEGHATALPEGPALRDRRGLEMRIWA